MNDYVFSELLMQCTTFEDLISSPDKKFLKFFTPIFTSASQQEDSSNPEVANCLSRKKMSRIPAPGSNISRLAPPGSMSKRPREGSLDLETGLDAKKSRVDPKAPATNLTKSKSKSMMSIAGLFYIKLIIIDIHLLFFLRKVWSII